MAFKKEPCLYFFVVGLWLEFGKPCPDSQEPQAMWNHLPKYVQGQLVTWNWKKIHTYLKWNTLRKSWNQNNPLNWLRPSWFVPCFKFIGDILHYFSWNAFPCPDPSSGLCTQEAACIVSPTSSALRALPSSPVILELHVDYFQVFHSKYNPGFYHPAL